MAKLSNKLVAMCSVAVGLIYAGSYAVTANDANPANAASDASLHSSLVGDISSQATSDSTNGNNNTAVNSTITASSDPTNSNNLSSNNTDSTKANSNNGSSTNTNSNSATSKTYKDGTYTGEGYDRRGTVEVTVKIAKGKISDVQITNYDMHYSESYIDPILPQQVLQRQSDNIDIVSGATSSSEDFQVAVQQALANAQQS